MASKKNKVKFNISNVHYAPIISDEDGNVSWDTPIAMPGAVSLSLDPQGEPESFYADGIEYYVINNNQGYDGDLEVAMIPEGFRTDILKETTDSNNVLVENATSETGKFALLFEFDGDVRKIRHVLYNCSASRPSMSAKTNEDTREVQTETLTVKARPLASGYVKAKTGDSTKASVYNNWYKSVYQPSTTPSEEEDGDDETAAENSL
jgi:phi13 family phage major tail protein